MTCKNFLQKIEKKIEKKNRKKIEKVLDEWNVFM